MNQAKRKFKPPVPSRNDNKGKLLGLRQHQSSRNVTNKKFSICQVSEVASVTNQKSLTPNAVGLKFSSPFKSKEMRQTKTTKPFKT